MSTAFTQSLQLTLPHELAEDGQSISVPIRVADFDSIVSIQLSINWDANVATYTGFELGVLPLLAIGDFQASQGELRLSWFDNQGTGRSLDDDSIIAYLNFTAMGAVGATTPLSFTNEPLDIQVFQATGQAGVYQPLDLTPNHGSITISIALGFEITIEHISCVGDMDGSISVALTAVNPDDYSLSWTGPDGFESTAFNLNNLAAGIYHLEISNAAGEVVFEYDAEIEEATAPLTIQAVNTIDTDCNEPTATAQIEVSGGQMPYSYRLNNIPVADSNFDMLAAGDYNLEITDAYGCMINQEWQIIAPDAPVIQWEDSLFLCEQSLVLNPQSEGMHLWSTGATTDSITVTQTGLYTVTVSNMANCSTTDSIRVLAGVLPEPVLEDDFLELCPADSLQVHVSGGLDYQWLVDTAFVSDINSANPFLFPDTTQQFSVMVSNTCGADTLSFEVMVFEILASAGPDTCIAPNTELELNASGGLFYEWTTGLETLSNKEIPNPIATPQDSTVYTVLITDINACETLDSVLVVLANNPSESILPYNMISPNDDGKNDVLDFGSIQKFGENTLKVYNRWGDLVYQKRNYQFDEERFDGTHEGEALAAGNYFYVLSFKEESIQQTLTIIRE